MFKLLCGHWKRWAGFDAFDVVYNEVLCAECMKRRFERPAADR